MKELWKAYATHRTVKNRNALVEAYMPLARRIATWFYKTPAWRMDDVESFSYIGLIDAVEKFDPERGVTFYTYAAHRIRGSITDQMRREAWARRDQSKRCKGWKAREYVRMFPFSFQEGYEDGDRQPDEGFGFINEDPKSGAAVRAIEDRDEAEYLMQGLRPKERVVMRKRFLDGKRQKEIGEEIGLSESRVCQLLSKALLFLRETAA